MLKDYQIKANYSNLQNLIYLFKAKMFYLKLFYIIHINSLLILNNEFFINTISKKPTALNFHKRL